MKKAVKWAFIVISSIFLVAVLAISYLAWYFDKNLCENSVFREVVSPDGVYKVVIFDRGCGATTGFSTHVSILSTLSTNLPNQPGSTLVFNGYDVPISVVWLSNSEVSISGSGSKSTYIVKTIKGKVSIQLSQ